MNDYLIYDLAKQRHHDVIDEVRQARTIRSRAHWASWTRTTTGVRKRFALVHGVTNRARLDRIEG